MMTFIARMKVKEGKQAEFEDLARQLTAKVRAHEPRNRRLRILSPAGD